jgi:hypothetical protein
MLWQKSEARNSKPETNQKFQIRMTKTACPTDKPLGRRAVSTTAKKLVGKCPPCDFIVFWILIFGHLILFRISILGFRIYLHINQWITANTAER